ncbi:HNH endonuclease [Mycobacteroides abscessus]|uniref:HNH endonuclease n=1 Tax=Mycobacteroides abscessus TaxID=36809 RepID=UPI000942E291|nr:HNH endonuclease [Mycobacteroides abscessus]
MSGWSGSSRNLRLPPNWGEIRRRILDRDNHLCRIRLLGCLGTASEVDHIVRGDDHSDENLRGACASCHARKSSAEGNDRKRQLRALRKRPPERHPGQR